MSLRRARASDRLRATWQTHARKFELEDLVNRPGTYFNPQTEVLVVVDDSPELDAEIFNMEEYEGADWVLISDEVPVDENRRDELLEAFQVDYHPSALEQRRRGRDELDELEHDDEEVGRGSTPAATTADLFSSPAHFCIFVTSWPAAWMHWM